MKYSHTATRIHSLINSLLPGVCQLCTAHCDGILCAACERSFPVNQFPSCAICDLPLNGAAPYCAECLDSRPAYQRALSGLRYEAPVDSLITEFKQAYGLHWVQVLCAPLLQKISRTYCDTMPTLLVPVPIHWRRRLSRGYNQSALLTDYLSRKLAIPPLHCLRKIRHTEFQKNLKRKQRMINLNDSFSCDGGVAAAHVAIIDDVLTTGATAECIANTLKQAGATRVDVWTIARTPKSHYHA